MSDSQVWNAIFDLHYFPSQLSPTLILQPLHISPPSWAVLFSFHDGMRYRFPYSDQPSRVPSHSDSLVVPLQVANFFCLLAFLVPHNFRLSALVMRAVLSVGILLFALWAALDICAADIFAWNLSFLVVNAAHVLHLTYTVWPPRVHQDLADLYAKVFKPLRVRRPSPPRDSISGLGTSSSAACFLFLLLLSFSSSSSLSSSTLSQNMTRMRAMVIMTRNEA